MKGRIWGTTTVTMLVLLLVGALISWPAQKAQAAGTFAYGDVFVSMTDGSVHWFASDGTPKGVLESSLSNPGFALGMTFDAAGNLYVTHSFMDQATGAVEKFNSSGVSQGTFGSGYCNPISLVFDSAGNAYVGNADCTPGPDLMKLDAAGNLLESYPVAIDVRGANWIDLAPDECTIYYTSDGTNVLRYNVCSGEQLDNFNTDPLPGTPAPDGFGAGAVQILPDGRVLVADSETIVLLNNDGTLEQTYDVPGETGNPWGWLGLDVADGAFWAANFGSGNVYKLDIDTGAVLASFNAGPGSSIMGVVVYRPSAPAVTEGRMTGGGLFVTGDADTGVPSGSRITYRFNLNCDPTAKHNKLDIEVHSIYAAVREHHRGRNTVWKQFDRFKLKDLNSSLCTDDPTIAADSTYKNPPPFNTYTGIGTGTYDGEPGATAEWIFIDAGKVGDRVQKLIVKDALGNVVLSVPQPGHVLLRGNNRAHK